MFTRSPLAPLFMIAALASAAVAAPAESSERKDRVAASFVLALGRAPTAMELAGGEASAALPLAAQLAARREALQRDPALLSTVTVKAWQDAYGRTPTADELKAAVGAGGTYTEQLKRHVAWLAAHPAEYAQVLHRAYRLLLQRDAFDLELAYWKPEGALPYALLLACLEDWARRNQPGLMVTTGIPTASVNSRYLVTARLAPAVAAEARVAAGLAPAGDAALAVAAGRNLVAVGAEGVSSAGGIHFVAAGSAGLVLAETKR